MKGRELEVRLSWKESQRLTVLEEVRAGVRTQAAAGATLKVTDRWIRKLLGRLRREGAAGLAHGNRGRESPRRIPKEKTEQVIRMYQEKYEGFNLTHFREMLLKRERIQPPCREIIRRVLKEAGLWQRRRKAPKHRLRRPRREREGELLQLDASLHLWLGPQMGLVALVGAIDDATGDVPFAHFAPAETTEAYFALLAGILRRRGVPQAFYTDRDSVFTISNAKEAIALRAQGRTPQTQFGRALAELGIQWIPAFSPQAKGRIERLWGTFQDRLLRELKLEGIRTIEEANRYLVGKFLPDYNRRFKRAAAVEDPIYRPTPSPRRLESILCRKQRRTLARDHTFSLEGKLWQVLPCPQVLALTGRSIEVRTTRHGHLEAWYGSVRLNIKPAPTDLPRAG